ncbi:hypothetical protein COT94_00165 [Candidatus Falkowbacteria bacterium CG10_big_fil_rev_8_21_14_0_10_37_14]|uniref:ABC transporter substrate-binding protein n=1 Tax=Candidatus Falkowbacteria bacterium CG10_big_fil_rev_8_21_14_0_10_37_14 TaxID=1974561 RepID=A0A2M6WUM6_9BACT|nr:extracellular solute-binding protein [Candidatus Falkowbacteria bacterium]PIT96480.1 MAG: hypothetical protein COT94_00165 [Candidatus Falkowbacteria bacterium CG10_big_fil_rev_8_21_14_0_10_37_14]
MKKIISLGLLFVMMATSGFGCKGISQDVAAKMQPITINYWRVWDGPDNFSAIIAEYNKKHPNITIKYRKLRYDEYEKELVNALAEDRGPDIFSINATWMRRYASKIAVMPLEFTMAYPVEKGTIQKTIVPELRKTRSISLTAIKNSFLETVYSDVVFDWENPTTKNKELRVYGLPLAVDTMAMFFNRDLLNNANISELSPYWNKQFQTDVKKLTKQTTQGEIVQAGISLGTGTNIERSADIMALLIMQNGGTIINSQNRAALSENVSGKDYNPGMDALRFYSDFANPTKDVYTWNSTLDNSLQMFMDGRLAITFGYAYHLPTIKAQAPKLNFGILPIPQIEGGGGSKNVADYWVETVSKKSKNINEAWDFIQFMTTIPENTKLYLASSGRLTALRAIVEEQKINDNLSIFAKQLLTSHTWYHGYNNDVAEASFKSMADSVAANPQNLVFEVRLASSKINSTLSQAKVQ